MKKISLKDIKNSLKRDEMRLISGGSGWYCGSKSCYGGAGKCSEFVAWPAYGCGCFHNNVRRSEFDYQCK